MHRPRLGRSPLLSIVVVERRPKRVLKHGVNDHITSIAIGDMSMYTKGCYAYATIRSLQSRAARDCAILNVVHHRLAALVDTSVGRRCKSSHIALATNET